MAQQVLLEAESFESDGGWKLDTQFIDAMGAPYLLAHGLGTIRVTSDHPRVPEKTLRLEFAVLGNDVLN